LKSNTAKERERERKKGIPGGSSDGVGEGEEQAVVVRRCEEHGWDFRFVIFLCIFRVWGFRIGLG
jgi:hypothetical protein